MSHTSLSHINVKDILNELDDNSANLISTMTIHNLQQQLQNSSLNEYETKFIKSIIKLGTMKFYLVPSINPAEPSIDIISKNLKAAMYVALHTTHEFYEFYNSPWILDLLHIHSYQKGEGRKLMEAFKDLHSELNIPGSLWTEIEKNVDYFSQFGFESLGKLGDNGEYLMKLSIEQNKLESINNK